MVGFRIIRREKVTAPSMNFVSKEKLKINHGN